MAKTLKQLLDAVMGKNGFQIPDAYANSPDADVLQLFYLANTSARMLRELGFNELIRTAAITFTAAESYSVPADFLRLVPDTAYVTNDPRPLDFPAQADQWAFIKATGTPTGLYYRLRFIDGAIAVLNPQAGVTVTYEYWSNSPITSAVTGTGRDSGGTPLQEFVTDSDVWGLDDLLFEMDVGWRFKKAKGLDWQADFQEFRGYVKTLRGRNAGSQMIGASLDPGPQPPYTSLWVPS